MASSGIVPSFFLYPSTKAAVRGIALRSLTFTTRATPARHRSVTTSPPPPPPQEKKSSSISTGELFLGIASLILENGRKIVNGGEENEMPVVERLREAPGFSFSAAGLLFPYHLGVAQLLIDKDYIKETTPLAGSSAGAIVCAAIASGVSMREVLQATKIMAKDCRLRGTAFRLEALLRNMLDQNLPDDVHIRSNGRVRVAITEILWTPRGLLVDQFDSKQDFIDAVLASSFVPGYLAPRPATIFRNRLCIDGGITLFTPPTSASQTVCVCAYPARSLGLQGNVISPDCYPESMPSFQELLNWSFEPAADDILDKLFELGYLNAAIWAEKNPVQVKIVLDESGYLENGHK